MQGSRREWSCRTIAGLPRRDYWTQVQVGWRGVGSSWAWRRQHPVRNPVRPHPTPGRPVPASIRRAQGVQDHGHVDHLLQDRALHRGQMAQGSGDHAQTRQPDPRHDALQRDAARALRDLDAGQQGLADRPAGRHPPPLAEARRPRRAPIATPISAVQRGRVVHPIAPPSSPGPIRVRTAPAGPSGLARLAIVQSRPRAREPPSRPRVGRPWPAGCARSRGGAARPATRAYPAATRPPGPGAPPGRHRRPGTRPPRLRRAGARP